ncbi:hypothetical protein BH721_00400 [Clostridium baratii]|uniref:Uncharacterized protein n=2 Tax=Clostridium baratii TaxID=1561 RepID=A0A0A7FUG4_9CLOT|nr:hypothetical protein [Clostridium baratii]AIY83242.1 hypothetical protein U729_753 [Clostridium baratii str. Sullivan]MBS6007038.1 hypothetical protein [Clostridium baratii]MDU1054210.1 hypothetical protein [Clostridium baratii]MDU4910917.1 hypothetical protein [Clostridium baratii]OPF50998.1 hypothetical protein A1M12_05915 [Clostridium baratii]
MTGYQKRIINYLEKNIILKGKKVYLGYDDKSVVIIDKNRILHFIYKDKKIQLVNLENNINI